MEEKLYYTVLYETAFPDSGIVSYKPIKAIKGYFDEEKETFKDLDTEIIYDCVNIALPSIGTNEEHILDALNDELEAYQYTEPNQQFFAFPIEEELMKQYCKAGNYKEDPLELYEREVRGYYLYSAYDDRVDANVFYVVDKFEHHTHNINVSLNVIDSVRDAEEREKQDQAQPFSVFVISPEAMQGVEPQVEQTQEKERESAFGEIIFDFDPDELEEKINADVIGQKHVVKALVSAMYKNKRYHNIDGIKSNVLILGPSGCGKTEIARSLARHLNIPMTIFDATSTSATGYVGTSVTQAIKDLISVCGGDIERAQNGIIVIDEIDKLASTEQGSVSKGDVQDELFKMLEGDEITIPADNFKEKSFRFNPKNITFIGIGSAQALIDQMKKDIENKKNKKPASRIGFNQEPTIKEEPVINSDEEQEKIVLEPQHLIKFGLKPELLRRFPVIEVVNALKTSDLVTILTDSKISNLRLYERAFNDIDHVYLTYDKEVLNEIAERATKEKAGASGLKRVVDDMLQTSVRKIRLLNGRPGELVLSKETLDDPDKFELYALDSNNKEKIYPQKEKVKTLGTKN